MRSKRACDRVGRGTHAGLPESLLWRFLDQFDGPLFDVQSMVKCGDPAVEQRIVFGHPLIRQHPNTLADELVGGCGKPTNITVL